MVIPSNLIPHLDLRTPQVFQAIGKNGLAYFLLANVLTGLVNLAIQTKIVSPCPAVLIVMAYMFTLHLVASICYVKKITIKFW